MQSRLSYQRKNDERELIREKEEGREGPTSADPRIADFWFPESLLNFLCLCFLQLLGLEFG